MNPMEASDYEALLPKEVKTGGEEGIYSNSELVNPFRLASIRIDPCANQLIRGASPCLPELRLVWQAVRRNADGEWNFVDSNVHSIYRLGPESFEELLNTLRALRATYHSTPFQLHQTPLAPHPEIAREGLDGIYYQTLERLLTKHAVSANLSHLAYFSQTAAGGHWIMLKYELNGKRATPLPIPGSKTTYIKEKFVQRLTLSSYAGLGKPSPLGPIEDNLYREELVAARFTAANRIENPRLHDVSDRDCASCHTVEHQRQILKEGLGNSQSIGIDAYRSKTWNLDAHYPIPSFASLQIFSYFPPRAVRIAARVIHDTAESADFVNKPP